MQHHHSKKSKAGVATLLSTNYCSMATGPSSSNSGRSGDSDSHHDFGVGRVDLAGGGLDGGDCADLQPGPGAAQRPLPAPHLPHSPQPHWHLYPSSGTKYCGDDVLVLPDDIELSASVVVVVAAAVACVSGRGAVPACDSSPNTTLRESMLSMDPFEVACRILPLLLLYCG